MSLSSQIYMRKILDSLYLNITIFITLIFISGLIRTTGELFDREVQENYTIVVSVRDGRSPARESHTLVHVIISDENDNVPTFVSVPYHAVVFVDAVRGEVVKQVGFCFLYLYLASYRKCYG